MGDRLNSNEDVYHYLREREMAGRLRNALTFCKQSLELTALSDRNLSGEQRLGFERCLTENYLLKHGLDYFGKRDLIYIDLFGAEDINNLKSSI